jgi:hypothetical protein
MNWPVFFQPFRFTIKQILVVQTNPLATHSFAKKMHVCSVCIKLWDKTNLLLFGEKLQAFIAESADPRRGSLACEGIGAMVRDSECCDREREILPYPSNAGRKSDRRGGGPLTKSGLGDQILRKSALPINISIL